MLVQVREESEIWERKRIGVFLKYTGSLVALTVTYKMYVLAIEASLLNDRIS